MKRVRDYRAIVISNTSIADDIALIELSLPGFGGSAESGQFVMIKVEGSFDPFLRRPYSIFRCSKERMEILVKVVGRGSEVIARKTAGSEVCILGPLGVGFSIDSEDYPILVAGGIGIAPIWFLAEKLQKAKLEFSMVFGERASSPLGKLVEGTFDRGCLLVTDDGSRGIKSTASDALPGLLDGLPYEKCTIYSCGPGGMLKKVIGFGKERNIPVYVSLEENMACGLGVCLGCSVKKRGEPGYLTVCRDGPVFKGGEVEI